MLGFFSLIICSAEDASHEVKKKMQPGLLKLFWVVLTPIKSFMARWNYEQRKGTADFSVPPFWVQGMPTVPALLENCCLDGIPAPFW